MKHWRRWAFVIALVVLEASYLAAWFIAKKSDAYAEAERFVRGSGVVAENVGSITSVSLEPLGLSLRFSGDGGRVAFEMAVEASRASGTADIELAKNGTWRVLAARLTLPNRQPISTRRDTKHCIGDNAVELTLHSDPVVRWHEQV